MCHFIIYLILKEIEEDKKKAEQEGIAVTTPRKPRPHEPETDRRKTEKENFTVTVDLSKPAGVRSATPLISVMYCDYFVWPIHFELPSAGEESCE